MRAKPSPLITFGLAVGWWQPAIHEQQRAPKWLWAVPAPVVLQAA